MQWPPSVRCSGSERALEWPPRTAGSCPLRGPRSRRPVWFTTFCGGQPRRFLPARPAAARAGSPGGRACRPSGPASSGRERGRHGAGRAAGSGRTVPAAKGQQRSHVLRYCARVTADGKPTEAKGRHASQRRHVVTPLIPQHVGLCLVTRPPIEFNQHAVLGIGDVPIGAATTRGPGCHLPLPRWKSMGPGHPCCVRTLEWARDAILDLGAHGGQQVPSTLSRPCGHDLEDPTGRREPQSAGSHDDLRRIRVRAAPRSGVAHCVLDGRDRRAARRVGSCRRVGDAPRAGSRSRSRAGLGHEHRDRSGLLVWRQAPVGGRGTPADHAAPPECEVRGPHARLQGHLARLREVDAAVDPQPEAAADQAIDSVSAQACVARLLARAGAALVRCYGVQ